jgi:hypothetical protein
MRSPFYLSICVPPLQILKELVDLLNLVWDHAIEGDLEPYF